MLLWNAGTHPQEHNIVSLSKWLNLYCHVNLQYYASSSVVKMEAAGFFKLVVYSTRLPYHYVLEDCNVKSNFNCKLNAFL